MSEEGYPSSSWDRSDSEHHPPHNAYTTTMTTQTYQSRDSLDVHPSVPLSPSRTTSPLRSSLESPHRPTHLRWRDSTTPAATPVSIHPPDDDSVLGTDFEENVLRALCDLDCGVPLLLDRIKQSMVSCKEAATFFKKRAVLEEEYARNLQKLARNSLKDYQNSGGKTGTFTTSWASLMRLHENISEHRLQLAKGLNEMSQELNKIGNDCDQERKTTKDLATRYERALQDAEAATDKSKNRVEVTAEELERVLLQKEGESVRDNGVQRTPGGIGGKRVIGKAVAKGGMLLKGKNPGNIQRQEDDIRARMSAASDMYRKNVTDTQAIRQEYFNFQLPRILRALHGVSNNLDLGTQYHLNRFAMQFEATVLNEGTALSPLEDSKLGVKAIVESIDNRADFKAYMQNYVFAHGGQGRGPRRDGPREDGFLPPIPTLGHYQASPPSVTNSHIADKGRPTFGVDLAEQMARDDVDVPTIMVKCCEAIEKYGLTLQGIYRVGGTVTKVAKLREMLDKDLDSVNLDADEWASDISCVTSALKQWLRELPDPLMTHEHHEDFLDAARNDNERLRHIRLHERVNDLPDPNYATIKYFMGHLHKISQHEAENSMSVQNIAIVFGPTLFSQAQPGAGMNGHMNGMADASLQNKAIETILEHFTDIFVDEDA